MMKYIILILAVIESSNFYFLFIHKKTYANVFKRINAIAGAKSRQHMTFGGKLGPKEGLQLKCLECSL